MDWSKTKSKLIIILLGLNILLLFTFFYKNASETRNTPSEETLVELEKRLENSRINLDADLPKPVNEIRPLIVKYEEEDPENINQNFFNGEGEIQKRDNISQISMEFEEITILNNRRFLYENFEELDSTSTNTDISVVNKFLEEKNFDTSDMILIKAEILDNTVTYEFAKEYNDRILETSYTRITVESGVVITIDRLWIEVIEEDSRTISIEPAYKALFTLIGKDDLRGKTINEIELCYYFNPEEQGLLEDNTRAERGRAIPAWRIIFDDGTKLVVDNY